MTLTKAERRKMTEEIGGPLIREVLSDLEAAEARLGGPVTLARALEDVFRLLRHEGERLELALSADAETTEAIFREFGFTHEPQSRYIIFPMRDPRLRLLVDTTAVLRKKAKLEEP